MFQPDTESATVVDGQSPAPSWPAVIVRHGGWLVPLLYFVGQFLLVTLSLQLSRESGNLAFIWLPNAVTFAACVRSTASQWRWLLPLAALAGWVGYVASGENSLLALVLVLANLVEVIAGVALVRHWVMPWSQSLNIRSLLLILLLYPLLAIPLGAVIASEAVHQYYGTPRLEVLGNGWLGDTIGFLLLSVPGLLIRRADLQALTRPSLLLDFLLTLAILTTISYLLMLHVPYPFIYICALLTAIAYRDGPLRTILHANLVLLLLGVLWWMGQIDLSALRAGSGPKGLWAAGAMTCLFPALLGMAVEDVRRQQRAVEQLTSRLRLASRALQLGIWEWNVGTRESHWDARMRELYDLPDNSPPLERQQWLAYVHPDDRLKADSDLQTALFSGDYNSEYRILLPSGELRHIRAAGIVLRDNSQQRLVGVNWDITAERVALQGIEDAQIRLNGVINAASEFSIIATSVDGIIEVFSEGAERMLGYRAEEVIGRMSPAGFHLPSEVAARGAELSEEYRRTIQGFDIFVCKVQEGGSESREWTYVRKDASQLPVRLVVTCIRDEHQRITGYLGVAQDISAAKKAQQILVTTNRVLQSQIETAQRARQEFENLFALAPGALLVVDSQGMIIKANTQSHDVFGYEQGELEGRSIEDLIPAQHRQRHVDHRRQFMQHPAPRLMAQERVLAAQKKSGDAFLAEITLSPLLTHEQSSTIAIVRDVTLQKQTERALADAKEAAESASRAKSDFLANMSHEIRTPLNAILGTAQLLERTPLPDDAQRYVQMIRTSGASLLGVINDVLDFSKIEAGKMELAGEPFDLEDILGSVANLMSISVGDKPIELAIGVAPGTPRRWLGDALRLNQILINLVGNAIKFTEQGEVVVQIAMGERQQDRAVLQCTVRDTGIGIDPAQQQRLFQAFSQADNSTTRRFGGSGLGLVICQRLIRMMGGDIQFDSVPGAGTEFRFSVSLALASQPPQIAPAKGRLLLVDGSATSRQLLAATLREWGWQVDVMEHCEAAQRHLQQDTEPYDGILVDWQQSALECLQHYTPPANQARGRRILMTSAFGRHQQRPLPPWDNVLIKPVTPQRLFDALNPPSPAPGANASAAAGPLQGQRLLLVEDNELNQVVACGLLEQAGAVVDVVSDGQQAIDRLRQDASPYQAILMDVQMPVMDGFTCTRLIRDELHLTLPIIAMSAGVMLAEQQQCLASGMNGFIAKPVDYERMLDTLIQYLPASRPRDPLPTDVQPPAEPLTLFAPDQLLRLVRGKPQRLHDLLGMIDTFIANGVTPIEQGRALLQQGDREAARRLFHTLKGSVGNLGGKAMWEAAQAVETAIHDGDLVRIEELLQQATDCLQRTVAAARDWVDRHPEYRQSP